MIVYDADAATRQVVLTADCDDLLSRYHQLDRLHAFKHPQLLGRIDQLPIDQKELDI